MSDCEKIQFIKDFNDDSYLYSFIFLLFLSYLEMALKNNDKNIKEILYTDLNMLKFTPSFYYHVAMLNDIDILRYIPKPNKEYDFRSIVNNANESIFHVAIAFSIYILYFNL